MEIWPFFFTLSPLLSPCFCFCRSKFNPCLIFATSTTSQLRMAIITEEPEEPKPSPSPSRTPMPQPKSEATTSSPRSTTNTKPFHFWFYFSVVVSLITLFFILLPSFSTQDPKTWFLNLPGNLRQHYAKGRVLKVQITPNLPQVEVFSMQEGPTKSDNQVLIVHGFGCSSFAFQGVVKSLGLKGVHAIAIDLPGSGFSDKSMVVVEENVGTGGVFGRFWDVYYEIKEKGIFWGFDQLVEKGYVNYEENENEIRVLKREVVKAIELGPDEMGRVLGQVIDAMGLAPVDLVLHDSALRLSANWIYENPGSVRSVVVLDSAPTKTALPLWALDIPVVREIVLGIGFVFERILGIYCLKSDGKLEAEAHRILLKGRDGRRAVVGMGMRLNYSFDLVEWGSMDVVKGLPLQVIWSAGSSKEWSEEGRRVANALPQATFVTHSGGQWPQEHNAEEIAKSIHQFVLSLPKSNRQAQEEPIPEHIQMMLNEAKSSDQHDHQHHHHGHGSHHGHDHHHGHAGYADAYGLGHGWAI